jgi:hypothetical protein
MLGFCAFLLHQKYAEEIKQCFLMVGHSHSDCDQYFSAIGPHVTKSCPLSLSELKRSILDSHPSENDTTCLQVEEIIGFKDFLKPFLLKLNNISIPLNYHLKINNGMVQLRSRAFSNSVWSNWMNTTSSPIPMDHVPTTKAAAKQVVHMIVSIILSWFHFSTSGCGLRSKAWAVEIIPAIYVC